MNALRKQLHTLHSDDTGLTLVEVLVTTFLLSIISVVFSGVMSSTMNATINIDGAARSNDDVRIAISQLDRDIRSAEQVCEPVDGNSSDRLEIHMQTASGVQEIVYEYNLDKDDDGIADADLVAELIRTVDGAAERIVIDSVINPWVSTQGPVQPMFISQAAGDEPGAPSFGKVIAVNLWVDANPRDDISPKLETTEISGRNIWNPNSNC
jgi:hypothetical protein